MNAAHRWRFGLAAVITLIVVGCGSTAPPVAINETGAQPSSDPSSKAQTPRWTEAELSAAMEETGRAFERAQINAIIVHNVEHNSVDVPVYDPARIEAKLKAANVELPAAARLVKMDGSPPPAVPEAMPTAQPADQIVYFPQQRPPDGGHGWMDALLIGTLVNDNGCLRVTGDGRPRTLVIWPPDVILDTASDPIEVRDLEGDVVARVGEQVHIGGGFSDPAPALLREPFPAACAGSSWIANEIDPLDLQRWP